MPKEYAATSGAQAPSVGPTVPAHVRNLRQWAVDRAISIHAPGATTAGGTPSRVADAVIETADRLERYVLEGRPGPAL